MLATKSIAFARPIIGEEERAAVLGVLEGSTLTHGPRVREFEEAFCRFTGARFAIATSSCTAALHLVYLWLGLQPGDEVIVPALSHVATAHTVELCGARPVFIDSEPVTGNMDLRAVEAAVTSRTRAICPMHYLGLPVDMSRLLPIARHDGLFVVEDCALALGARLNGTHAGLLGDAGCFSFYPAKHVTTAEGGMLITTNAELAAGAARLRAFGIDCNVVGERPVPGDYDVVALGPNYRLNELSAALGLAQMERLPDGLQQRAENYRLLEAELRSFEEFDLLRSSHGAFQSSYYCLVAVLRAPINKRRLALLETLKQAGVQTSIYYPRPIPMMSYYRNKYGCADGDFPVAARIANESVAIPVGPHLDADDIRHLAAAVKQALVDVRAHG